MGPHGSCQVWQAFCRPVWKLIGVQRVPSCNQRLGEPPREGKRKAKQLLPRNGVFAKADRVRGVHVTGAIRENDGKDRKKLPRR